MESTSHWDLYWQQNTSGHSFNDETTSGRITDAYIIKDFWQAKFACFPSPALIVDIATGNGALVDLAANYAHSHDLNWYLNGIDSAKINPIRSSCNNIKFLSETSMDCLPFDDASVDVACSQFGFEYGPTNQAVAEVLRILKPGGRFIAMVHSTESIITQNSKSTTSVIGDLEERSIFQDISTLALENDFSIFQRNLLTKLRVIRELYQGTGSEAELFAIIAQLGSIIKRVNDVGLANTIAALHHFVTHQRAHFLRLSEQQGVAYDIVALDNLASLVQEKRGLLSYNQITINDAVYAWEVNIFKQECKELR